MNDIDLKQKILDELKWEPSIDAAHIGVTAHEGVVTLSGHVGSYSQKMAAEHATGRVAGVKGIAEEIEVRYTLNETHDDENIAKQATHALQWDLGVPNNKIMVKVEKGYVTLTGEVDWYFQKQNAEADVRKLHGVMGINDQIKLKSTVETKNLTNDINTALHRSTFFNPSHITVTADGGKVTLRGKVDNYYERTLAQTTAWKARGVTQIENLLTVNY